MTETHPFEVAGEKTRVTARANEWFLMVKKFREDEGRELIDSDASPEVLISHRNFLEQLIGLGQGLVVSVIKAGGLDVRTPYTVEDISATIDGLRTTLLMWHLPMSEERQQEILTQLDNA